MDTLGLQGIPYAFCADNLPRLLEIIKAGTFPEKWFFPTSTNKNRLASYYTFAVARLLQQPMPRPEPINLRDVGVIARWLAERLETVPRTVVRATTSIAMRISRSRSRVAIR